MDGIQKLARSGSMNLRRKGHEDVRRMKLIKFQNRNVSQKKSKSNSMMMDLKVDKKMIINENYFLRSSNIILWPHR